MSEELKQSLKFYTISSGELALTLRTSQNEISEASLAEPVHVSQWAKVAEENAFPEPGIAVFVVADHQELSKFIPFLVKMKAELKSKRLIAFAMLKNPSPRIEEVLTKAGVTEILTSGISAKTLAHKLRRSLTICQQARKKSASDDQIQLRSKEPAGEESASVLKVELVAAVEHPDDYWLFRHISHAKFVNQQWYIEIIGPAPWASGKNA